MKTYNNIKSKSVNKMKTQNLKKISLCRIKMFNQINSLLKSIAFKIFKKKIYFRHRL
jgi:hypothetical protein